MKYKNLYETYAKNIKCFAHFRVYYIGNYTVGVI